MQNGSATELSDRPSSSGPQNGDRLNRQIIFENHTTNLTQQDPLLKVSDTQTVIPWAQCFLFPAWHRFVNHQRFQYCQINLYKNMGMQCTCFERTKF
ncbi:MAG: hypothetical protein H0W64_11700 [Gammaproteobacteria bacterium]|nr:hypothetical protein [Gammaproteobacteria bacterium]